MHLIQINSFNIDKINKKFDLNVNFLSEYHNRQQIKNNIASIIGHRYLLLTATHSLRSSPSGNNTANLKLPEPSVAAACFIRSY